MEGANEADVGSRRWTRVMTVLHAQSKPPSQLLESKMKAQSAPVWIKTADSEAKKRTTYTFSLWKVTSTIRSSFAMTGRWLSEVQL